MKNVIFDLDGTLVDSLAGIEQAVGAAIIEVMPEVKALPNLRDVIGPPISVMFTTLWPELADLQIQRLVTSFRSHYLAEGCLQSIPFPSVPETLLRLSSRSFQLFVLTNKPAAPTRKILDHLGMSRFFAVALSPDSTHPAFPSKSDGARHLTNSFCLEPAETILIGDGVDDMAAAESCGFGFIAAAYGYGAAAGTAERRIEKFSEIEDLLL